MLCSLVIFINLFTPNFQLANVDCDKKDEVRSRLGKVANLFDKLSVLTVDVADAVPTTDGKVLEKVKTEDPVKAVVQPELPKIDDLEIITTDSSTEFSGIMANLISR